MRRISLLALLVLAPFAVGQEEAVGRPYWISTPPPAREALVTATAAVAAGDWPRAAQKLQVVFDKHAGAFARLGRRGPYVGARQRAVELMASMPKEVRAEYERLYGAGAARSLREALDAGDRAGLLDVVRRYEATSAGLRAILALADSALLRGRPAEARLLLARVKRLHATAMGQTAFAKAFLQRFARAAALDHAQGGPAPSGDETRIEVDVAQGLDTHAWPMLGGNSTRTRRADAPGLHPIVYSIGDLDIRSRMYDQPPRPTQYHLRRRMANRVDWEDYWRDFNPVQPVIARGQLVFSNGRRLEATNLYSHVVSWQYPPEPDFDNKGRTNLSSIFSPVVADGIVYAAIETPVEYRPQRLQSVPITYYLPMRRLVAIDLESGEVLWSHENHALAGTKDAEVLRDMTIVGPPLVRGDRLYVGATLSRGTFHNRLVAFDRRTGKLLYDTRLSNGQQELNLFGRQLQEAAGTPVAETDGVLYYGTNQGVIAAVDALLGTPLWATTYAVVPIPSTYLWFEAPRRWPRFDNGPPLVVGDLVLVAPTDGTHLMALDKDSGAVVWTKSFIGDRNFGFRPRVLQAADGARVYVSGDAGVAALWLKDGPNRRAGSTAWMQPFEDEGDKGGGRGFLARNGLWIPTYTSIYRYHPVTGKLLDEHTRVGQDANQSVHLVAGDGVLVTAGRNNLSARFEESEVIRLAEARMRLHPDEVGPILAAADIYLATGRVSLAIERYRRAKRFAAARGIPAAERRSQSGLHRALLLRAEEALDERPEGATADFEAAFRAAPDETARLRARLALDALLAGRGGREFGEWRLRNLREIAQDYGARPFDESGRTVRGWALREMARLLVARKQTKRALAVLHKLVETDPDGPDGRHASGEMRLILESEGRQHYAPYEKRARQLFEAALASGDLQALGRALLIYANAEAAADATLQLAERRMKGGDPTAAAHALQRFLVERPGAPQVPQALLLMVRALHARGSYGPAYSTLRRLQRLYSDVVIERADGARLPAGEIAGEWLRRDPYPRVAKSAHRRDLQSNLTLRFEKKFNRGPFVDVPDLLGQRPPALREAVLLKMGRTLLALDTRDGDELYRIAFEELDARGPIVLVDRHLLAVTERHVYGFDARTGRAKARKRIPGGGKGLALIEHQGQVFLLFRQRGMRGTVGVAALHPADLEPIWTTIIPTDEAHERVTPRFTIGHGDRLLIFAERPVRLTVVNTTTGAIENRAPVDAQRNSRLAVAPRPLPDGRVLLGLWTKKRTEGFAWQHSYEVHLLDPGKRADHVSSWVFVPPSDSENRYLHMLNVVGEHVVALDDALGAAVFGLKDGKLVKWTPALAVGAPAGVRLQLTANQAVHDSLLLVTTRARASTPARLTAFELPSLRTKYSIAVTESGRETAEVIDADGVLGMILMPNAQQRTRSRIRLYDPLTARMLQEIVPGDEDVGWFTAKVQNGILIVSPAGHAAYAYGPR
ncbi:MAG: outer membrane protein assembly factor BamB family protein [Planctomycetota bacterium]